ncbi:hypothetical protein EX30DRAFT_257267 [Ascodesmis nigricans]|uniref:Uncharacterized protein n=1 Tax=Ascodesmis nigricans TaxID=341454 RepID=A0A4V3SHI0_9PEZI|nr:hypothetical protein EX30DRAFT_257267 [Ascodesmis nigricans]
MHEWRYDDVDSWLRSGEFLVVRQGGENGSGQSHQGMEYDYEHGGHHISELKEGVAKLISRHVWKQYNINVRTELIDEHGVGNLFRYVFHDLAYTILYKPRLPIEKWKYKGIRSWLQRGIIEIVPIQPDDISSGPSSSSGPPSSSVAPPTSSTRQPTPRWSEDQEVENEDTARLAAVQALIATHIREKFGVRPAFKTVGIYNIGSEFETVYSGEARALVLRRMASWGREEVQRALKTGEMRVVRRGQGDERPERGEMAEREEREEKNGARQRSMSGDECSRERNEIQQEEKRGSNPTTSRREREVIDLLDDDDDGTGRIEPTATTTSTRITTTYTVVTTIPAAIKHTHTNTGNHAISPNDNTEDDEGSPMSLSGTTPDPVPVPQLHQTPGASGTLIPPPPFNPSDINMDTEMELQRGEEMDIQVQTQLNNEIRHATKNRSPRKGEPRSQSMGGTTALNASGQQRAELIPPAPAPAGHHHPPPPPPAIHSNHSTSTPPPRAGPTPTDIAMVYTHPHPRLTAAPDENNNKASSSSTDSDSDATETDEELLLLVSVENLGDLPAGGGKGVIPVTPWFEEEAVGSVLSAGGGNGERTREGATQDGDCDADGGEEVGAAKRKKSRFDEPTRPVPSAPGTAASTTTATRRLQQPTATPSSPSSSASTSSTLPRRPETVTKSCPPPPLPRSPVLGPHSFPLPPRPTVDQNPHQQRERETNLWATPATTRDVKQETQQSHQSQESEREEGEVREAVEVEAEDAEEDEGELPTDPWKRHLEMLRRRKRRALRELAMAGG